MKLTAKDIPFESNASGQRERRVWATCARDIHPRAVTWLWDQRIPLGALSLLAGREGIGKTLLAHTLAAQVTRGQLPGAHAGRPRAVFIIATEDSWEYTIVPRLLAAGADLDLVFRLQVGTNDQDDAPLALPRDLESLIDLVSEKDAALVIFDPLVSRLDSSLDTHKDADVRRALEPLSHLADRTGVALLGLMHVNKSQSSDPASSVMGSRAFPAVARMVLYVMEDPHDETRRLVGVAKTNVGPDDARTLLFKVATAAIPETSGAVIQTGALEWLGEGRQSLREAFRQRTLATESGGTVDGVGEWLVDRLKSGPQESSALKAEGGTLGFSSSALDRARRRKGIAVHQMGFPRRTLWSLSATPPTESSAVDSTDVTETTGPVPVQSHQSHQLHLPPCDDVGSF